MKKIGFVLLGLATLLVSCQTEQLENTEHTPQTLNQDAYALKGLLHVKVSRDVATQLNITRAANGDLSTGNTRLTQLLQELHAKSMTPVFPATGRFAERRKKAGLDLWYTVAFDEQQPTTRAMQALKKIEGIDIVEQVYEPVFPKVNYFDAPTTRATTQTTNTSVNDPEFPRQWNFFNDGSIPGAVVGADINVQKAWQYETGKPQVIVNVVDGGVDYDHEDLRDNMWVNTAELNGKPGVDDDNNGYVDDIHGYNFVGGYEGPIQKSMKHGQHGTHVAGVIAARSNNGIGVSGIAGGFGNQPGVKIMNSQMNMDLPENERRGSNTPAAIVYGADNGAVISQNSWGFLYEFGEDRIRIIDEAIMYFIKYAGCDEQGNQLPNSPMKGGVVIFAAGNDGKHYRANPASHDSVIAVGAIGPDNLVTSYTNYGSWLDIDAPGGNTELDPRAAILSTTPDNTYKYMEGTSMACPHVSGVAALIVSKFGKPGFTNTELKQRLAGALKPLNPDVLNPKKKGWMGRGYLDAAMAFAENQHKAPKNIEKVEVSADFTQIALSWQQVADEDDGTPLTYLLYVAESELNANNYTQVQPIDINALGYQPGTALQHTVDNLKLNTTYYLALVAQDRWGLTSSPIFLTAKTRENHAPRLTRKDGNGTIKITGQQTVTLDIEVEEPENQTWTYKLSGDSKSVSISQSNRLLQLAFTPKVSAGQYEVVLAVSDVYGATTELKIPYEVYINHTPKLAMNIQKSFVAMGKDMQLDLNQVFTDEDNTPLVYTAKAGDTNVAQAVVENNRLVVKGINKGTTAITLTASDPVHETAKTTFEVQVVENKLVYFMYPTFTKDFLHLQLNNEVTQANVTITNIIGQSVLKTTVNITQPDQRALRINVRNLPVGTYLLRLEAQQQTFEQTFNKI